MSSAEVPVHVGIIMDGNRRWARARGMPAWRGHAKGQEVLRQVAHLAFERGVKYLSVYAFSTENWKRTEKEVSYLMRHIVVALEKYLQEFIDGGVKVVFLANREALPKSVLKAMDNAEAKSASNTGATLAICLNYGGQQEVTDATKSIVEGGVAAADITTEVLAQHLYQPGIPPIDLLIRTGGERRLSNFMLYRAAYAELYFTDTLWPDFTEGDLQAALDEYASRLRRFGS